MGILYKKNNLKSLTTLIFLLVILNGTASAGSEPSTWYVDATGSGNYTTIQDAVDNSTSGDTIIVYPGMYDESVDVTVENLSICSYSGNPEDTIVRHVGSGHNFEISANNITISGFGITGTNSTGIYASGISGANITNNKLSGIGCAVQMQSSSRCNLTNNIVDDSAQYGFYLQSSNNCTLSSNTVSNTVSYGIYLYDSVNCSLAGNMISNIPSYGTVLYLSSYCNLTSSTISDIDEDGIYLNTSDTCNLTGNSISNTHDDGIKLEYSDSCNLTSNTISDIDEDGIYLYTSNTCDLTANSISNTYNDGIRLGYSESCNLISNTISNIDEDGIYLYDSTTCNLTGNNISNTYDEGIEMENSQSCNLISNNISNTYYGIEIDYSESCNLTSNTISDIDEDGIYLYDSNTCDLTGNSISNTYNDGIRLGYSESCNLISNNISNTYDDGIMMEHSENCNLFGNTISNISDDGIHMYDSSRCNLFGNTISDSYYGLYISSARNCTITNNTASSGRYGFNLYDTENCTLIDNIMSGNWYNFGLDYDEEVDLDNPTGNIIDTSNLVDGKPIYYFEREANPSIGRDAGVIYCINCGNTEIKDCVLQNNTYAILLYNTSSNIQNNTINNTMFGVGVISSHDIRISDSRFRNSFAGVMAQETMNVTITENSIQNSMYGIITALSENCTLTENNIQNLTAPYPLYMSENPDLVNAEESVPIKENSFTGSSLVQYSELSHGLGIYSVYSQNLNIEDNIINQSYRGIYLEGCQNSDLARNSIRNIMDTGIYSEQSSNVKLLDNMVQNVTGETQFYDAGNYSLVGRYSAYGFGIYFDSSQNLSLVRNSVRDIACTGIYSEDSSNVELLENTVQNVTGSYSMPKAGNSSLVGLPLLGDSRISGYGIYFDDLEDLRLEGNTVKNCYQVWGIYLLEPVNATVKSNTLQNCQGGLITVQSKNFSVSDCSVTNCTSGGILVVNTEEREGDGYTISDCAVEGSYLGLVVIGEGNFTGNTLSGNSYGLVLYNVNNSLICGNTFAGNSLAGIAFDVDQQELVSHIGLFRSMESPASGNNIIYNNYFNNVNNTLYNSNLNNTWNTSKTAGENIIEGPYLGGNYWANPNGRGFSQTCTDAGKDGIADSAYEIENGTYDYLPLTEIPVTRHRSSANYVPSGGSSGVTGIDSAQKKVNAGTKATFSFNNPVSGVLGLSFTPQQYSGSVVVRIETLEGISGEKPEGEVYQIMNILVGNERFENESNINGANISFRVAKSWVEENNIDVSTITINRFHNEKWNPLVTGMTHEDEEYYYFTAETPGFSRYAITGDKLGEEIITPVEQEENGTITGEEQTKDEKSAPGFESAFAVLGILASVFFARKRILK